MHPERQYALITFGGFDAPDRDLSRLAELRPIQFVRTLPHSTRKDGYRGEPLIQDRKVSNLWHFAGPDLYHPDLVAAVDAVITKPGYGILSETMPLGIPLLLDTREDFREFKVVKTALSEYPQVAFLDPGKMLHLDFADELKALLARPRRPWKGAVDSGEFIMKRIQ
jgi:hypothetical protein